MTGLALGWMGWKGGARGSETLVRIVIRNKCQRRYGCWLAEAGRKERVLAGYLLQALRGSQALGRNLCLSQNAVLLSGGWSRVAFRRSDETGWKSSGYSLLLVSVRRFGILRGARDGLCAGDWIWGKKFASPVGRLDPDWCRQESE